MMEIGEMIKLQENIRMIYIIGMNEWCLIMLYIDKHL